MASDRPCELAVLLFWGVSHPFMGGALGQRAACRKHRGQDFRYLRDQNPIARWRAGLSVWYASKKGSPGRAFATLKRQRKLIWDQSPLVTTSPSPPIDRERCRERG